MKVKRRKLIEYLKNTRIIKILIVIILLTSCGQEVRNESQVNNKKQSDIFIEFLREGGKPVKYFYKDSVYLAIINYSSDFDTITKTLFEEKYPQRRIFYKRVKETDVDMSDEKLDFVESKTDSDSLYAANSSKIPFEVKFEKVGVNYLNGIVYDLIFLQTKDTSKIRQLSKKYVITEEIIVNDYQKKQKVETIERI